ncbi:MAG: MFS transporter, partial [Culicoidibacterales bacterium]
WLIENSSNASIYTSLSNVLILAGMAVMSLVLIKIEKLRNKNQWFITGGLLLAIPFLLGLIQAIPNVIFVTALIFGAGTTLINNAVTFLFVEHTENEYLARVGAILSTCVQGSVAISIPLAAIIVNSTSYQLYVFIVAVIFFVIALGNQLFLKSNSTEKLNECTQEV